ncbi:MAG: hypothetical protein MI922_04440 [Bacteroidales bacterium]|nr:hypothetical protein [Bacteroidales bacterium]
MIGYKPSLMCKLLAYILFLLCICEVVDVKANMASPIVEGTYLNQPYLNEFVDIIHENINIVIDDSFSTAQFHIEYHINALEEGIQVPFLFYAPDVSEDFTICIGNDTVILQNVPVGLELSDSMKFKDFLYLFEDKDQIILSETQDDEIAFSIGDLIYFESDIAKGEQVITVQYTADYWTNMRNWANIYFFSYALAPASYWKSFGTLKITLDARSFSHPITTNLHDLPNSGLIDSVAVWEYDSIPTDVLNIMYHPRINKVSKLLIFIGPLWLSVLIILFVVWIHVLFIKRYRHKNPGKKFSVMVFLGSFVVPLVFVILASVMYSIIDLIIGKHASGMHGYSQIFVFFLYPLVLPIYWTLMWLTDKSFKQKQLTKKKININ